jgi:hypothetical protein
MPARKRFLFRVESNAGAYRHATEDWDFDAIVREVNGSMMVTLKTDQQADHIGNGITDPLNAVTITVATPTTGPLGLDYFTGYFPKRSIHLQPDDESVELMALGHASRLFEMFYIDPSTSKAVFDYTGAGAKASTIAQDVIDKARALDASYRVNYTGTSVEDSTDTIKDKFELQRSGDVLNRLVFLAYDASVIWYWRVLGDNVFSFRKSSTTSDHQFTYGLDIAEFPELSEDLAQAKNEVYVVYNDSASQVPQALKRVVDAASIATYGNRAMFVRESNVPDSTTATEIANAYLQIYKPPLRTVRVVITDAYAREIETINPGDTCQVLNLPPDIANLLTANMFITRTTYRKDTVELELVLKHPQIESSVEAIRRRFDQQQTQGIPTTYS